MVRSPKLLAALAALVVLLGACATSSDDADPPDSSASAEERTGDTDDGSTEDGEERELPPFEEADCTETDYFDPDDVDAFCGTVAVPEDHDDPDGPTIDLDVMVIPAESDDPEPDPVLYLDGGPGGDGMGNAASFAAAPWHEDRDIILFTQRGTGTSDPSLDCENSDEALEEFLPLEPDSDEAEELSDELFVECRDLLLDEGVDLQQYSSAESARDIALLRQVLGAEMGFDEWNLHGISYGTRLALTVLRDEPEGIRSVIIDSVYPPTRDLGVDVGPNAQAAFDTLFERCADDPTCDRLHPDLAARWEALVASLEEDPVTVEAEALASDLAGEVLIDGDTAVHGLFQMLYVTSLIPSLPELIDDLEDGNFDYFASILLELSAGSAEGISEGMYYSVQCQEEIPFSSEELALEAMEGLDPVVARVFDPTGDYDDCEVWGVEPSDEIENEAVSSDVPTLVMAGAFDPITPVSWAEEAAETLENHWLVVIEASGHGASLDACGEDVVAAFLDDPDEDPTLPCASESAEIEWD